MGFPARGTHHWKKKGLIQEVKEDFRHLDFWVFSIGIQPSFLAYFWRGLLAI
jgi:hypothetical protein